MLRTRHTLALIVLAALVIHTFWSGHHENIRRNFATAYLRSAYEGGDLYRRYTTRPARLRLDPKLRAAIPPPFELIARDTYVGGAYMYAFRLSNGWRAVVTVRFDGDKPLGARYRVDHWPEGRAKPRRTPN